MGVCTIGVLNGQTAAVLRNICGAAAEDMMAIWEGPHQVLQGDAAE